MKEKPNYWWKAFNARPLGMFVAPNWVGLAAFGLLGLSNPGFWILGAGLELGYLLTLATNARFQRTVASRPLSAARAEWNTRIAQRADDVVVRREPCAGDTVRNHLGVAQDGRTARKRLPRGTHEACAERDMAGHLDAATGMDHAHDNVGFLARKTRKVGFRPDDGE